MKKLFVLMVIGISVVLAGVAGAAPFLVCDAPAPAEQVVSYIVYQDGVEIVRPNAIADGSLRLDIGPDGLYIPPGVYTFTLKAVNVWGESGLSNPYISPSGVTVPQSTRMEP